MVALELETPYPADYNATVQQVARENETGYLPPLKTKIDRIEQYDFVFVGFPTWGMRLPPPMKSFLRQTQPEGEDGYPVQHECGVRRREQFSDGEGTVSAEHGAGRLRHPGRSGKGRTTSGYQRGKGGGGAERSRELVEENKDVAVKAWSRAVRKV